MHRTERLILREWVADDVEPFVEMCADLEVMEHFPHPLTRDESLAFIELVRHKFVENGFGLWALECNGRFAGFVGLNRTNAPFSAQPEPCHEVGWRLAKWAWGNGYATEAAREALRVGFEELNLDIIYSWTSHANHRSEEVMKRIGMSRREDLDFIHPATPGWHGAEHVVYSLTPERWREYGK